MESREVPTTPTDRAATPEHDELGTVLRDYMDVTRRLQKTHATLQNEVTRLRDELASKDRELEVRRRLSALGELAAGLAHEVRNPLGAIQLYSNLLRKECGTLSPALDLIGKIETGIQAIDGVVRDTLALAPKGPRRTACPLGEVISTAADNCRQKLMDEQVELTVNPADADVRVLAEGDSLQRVLVNLIVNAAEASGPGGRVWLDVAGARDGEVELRVTDAGPGLPDEALDRLFDPFFTTKERGTGLGLTIAHRLVEAYGGHLSARNRTEGGAEFTVVLPAEDDSDSNEHTTDPAREMTAA